MRRVAIAERPDWRATAEKLGFKFADMYGAKYWDESAYFALTLSQVEGDLEDPSRELHQMCLELAGRAAGDERLLNLLGVPEGAHDYVSASWRNRDREPSLYGRFDLAYDGTGPAKMLEYNADTPTGLYESAVFQWAWLEDCLQSGAVPATADQFNSIHEALVGRFGAFPKDSLFHFTGYVDDVEDGGTIDYLTECAIQAGHRIRKIGVDRVGIDAQGRLTDEEDLVIDRMFKLHPWEWIFDSEYAGSLRKSGCNLVEPAWKAMLSTKAILPLLWEANPGHPNLLPSFFEGDPRASDLKGHARKPIFSREGANVTLVMENGRVEADVEGPYADGPFVLQEATRLYQSPHGHAVIGAWIVGDEPCGVGIREDSSAVTMNLSRFVPHAIVG